MGTINWTLDSLAHSLLYIRPAEERQESALSESASIAIDARVSVFPMGENHPLVSTFGIFEDEALWDDLIRNMEENRKEAASQELFEK